VDPCDKIKIPINGQCDRMPFTPSMQDNPILQAKEECLAYKKQVACMVSRKNECNGDPVCEGFIEYKISQTTETMKEKCETAGMP
jgi:hypothetical protein